MCKTIFIISNEYRAIIVRCKTSKTWKNKILLGYPIESTIVRKAKLTSTCTFHGRLIFLDSKTCLLLFWFNVSAIFIGTNLRYFINIISTVCSILSLIKYLLGIYTLYYVQLTEVYSSSKLRKIKRPIWYLSVRYKTIYVYIDCEPFSIDRHFQNYYECTM